MLFLLPAAIASIYYAESFANLINTAAISAMFPSDDTIVRIDSYINKRTDVSMFKENGCEHVQENGCEHVSRERV